MISKEFIESFKKVLDYYKIEKEDVFDIVRAISFSESEGTHPIKLKDLASSGVDYFSDIVSDKINSKHLPDARLARVMVDSLSVILYVTNNSLFSSPDMISVLTASSDSVHKVCQKVVNYYNPSKANHLKFDKTSNYRTIEESERDMKRLLSTCKDSIDYSDTFNYTESILQRIRTLLDKVDGHRRGFNYSIFENIYLPKNYNNYDFNVSTKYPRTIVNVTDDCKKDFVEDYNLLGLLEVLLHYISFENLDVHTARYLCTDILVDISDNYSSKLPIGVACSISARPSLYVPERLLTVASVKNLYNYVFSNSVPLTRSSIDTLLDLLFQVNNIKEVIK